MGKRSSACWMELGRLIASQPRLVTKRAEEGKKGTCNWLDKSILPSPRHKVPTHHKLQERDAERGIRLT